MLFDILALLLKEPQLTTVMAKVVKNKTFPNDLKLKNKIHSNHKWLSRALIKQEIFLFQTILASQTFCEKILTVEILINFH